MASIEKQISTIKVSGVDIEVERRGSGSPVLVLYGEEALELSSPVIDAWAAKHELIIPSPPGFGHSERPEWIAGPDDIAYIYLDLLDQLGLNGLPVVGFGLGGWIAFEMVTKDPSVASKIVVVDPFGVKIGGPTDRDVQDIWTLHPQTVAKLKWHNVEKGKRDFPKMTEDELSVVARNVESFARFCWEPYMHNPNLRHRLGRVKVPTLFVWGADDGVITADYGRAYAALVAGSKFETIAEAGHYPHLEQPDAFRSVVDPFLG